MAHEETRGPITDSHERLATSFEAREGQAHLATSGSTDTYLGQTRQLTAILGPLPELSSLSAEAKPERSTEFSEHKSRSPREIAILNVRVAVLVGIIWFALMWTGVAVPTHSYQGYAVDFSRQPLLQGRSNLTSYLPTIIPRARLDLAVHLGLRNKPGPYDVVLVQDGMRYAFASGNTKLENHKLILRVKLDLSQVPAGESQLGIRPAGWEWTYYKVILKSTH